MLLRLSKYNIKLKHIAGRHMYIADLLSRYCDQSDTSPEINDLNEVVHSINVSKERKEQLVKETENDPILEKLKEVVSKGWPNAKSKLNDEIKPYWKLKDNIVEHEGLLFLNERIIIPLSLRKDMLNLLHKTHQGIEKTKMRARSIMYWPGITQDIENKIATYDICQRFRNTNPKEPYTAHEIIDIPYNKIGMDICEIDNKYYLVTVDYFSKYLDILPIRHKTTNEIILKLKSLFATHGIPKIIIADNNPFGSYVFRQFCKAHDIEIITTSPRYPQANGLAERSVQTAKKLIAKCKASKEELWLSLLEYRNTPIKNCEKSPAEILMGRKQRTHLPITTKQLKERDEKETHKAILQNNHRNKQYYDKTAQAKNPLKQGQQVWYKNNKIWEKGKVQAKHSTPRSYWILTEDGSQLRRNSRFLRPRQ